MPPSIEAQLGAAQTRREQLFQRAQLCYDLINKKDKVKIFLERCKSLEDTLVKFEDINQTIALLNQQLPEESLSEALEVVKTVAAFDELYFTIRAYQSQIKEELAIAKAQVSASTAEQSAPPPKEEKVKLPTITIPTFNGHITDFPSWKSMFVELIHSNRDLSDIQKFTYLRAYLSGSALAVIDSITLSSQNYALAFKTLVDRFSKTRLLASHHINTILAFQPLISDNVNGLRGFLDHYNIPVQSLKGLNVPNLDDFILLQLALKVLDKETSKEFETQNVKNDFPKFSDLVEFVQNKCSILEVLESSGDCQNKYKPKPQVKSLVTSANHNSSYKKLPNQCSVCRDNFHIISKCPKFIQMTPSKRFGVIKDRQMCFSCFSPDHGAPDCPSMYRCRTCGSATHNTMLHPDQGKSGHKPPSNQSKPGNSQTVLSGVAHTAMKNLEISELAVDPSGGSSMVLLGTATVQVQSKSGEWIPVRCVIDPGSQISAISESLVQALGLMRKKSNLQVLGIGSAGSVKSRGVVSCAVLPHVKLAEGVNPLSVETIILPSITSNLPSCIPFKVLRQFDHLQLADLSYISSKASVSTSIDLLLGVECYTSIVTSSLPIIQGSPSAIPSRFGWLLMGRVCEDDSEGSSNQTTSLFISSLEDPIASQLQRFWELENMGDQHMTPNPDDETCEMHFQETHSRNALGQYIVKLPFRGGEPPTLESNRAIAFKRMENLGKKLNRNPDMKNLYCENLNSYLKVGHMDIAKHPENYLLVHHGVYKEGSSSTPLRVVFDPNISKVNQSSLSETLLVGPKLQKDIGDILIQFRLNRVALLCDIKGMYRCIWLAEEDCRFQHILWYDEKENIVEYELKTVTFGLPPSPFLAQRVIQQLVLDEGENYPCASQALQSVYVDDVVTGANSISQACALKEELTNLMSKGGFQLRKWASSHSEVLADLPEDMCETTHSLGDDDALKVLGVQWSPNCDVFFYQVKSGNVSNLTKRKILSVIASVYDPNGFLSPVTIWLKIFMQQIWLHKDISWDSNLPPSLQTSWNRFISEIPVLEQLRIARHIPTDETQSIELVGMSDGSSVAYAAVVYLRVTDKNGAVTLHLIRAKCKVMPLKTITINRSELSGSVLLAQIISSLSFLKSKIDIKHIYLFSDSTTVLAWLKTPPHSLKTFVANRVVKILDLTKGATWHHVSSADNSADSASRGMLPTQFIENSKLWFHGPEFLKSKVEEWPQTKASCEERVPELKVLMTKTKEKPYMLNIIEKFSSLSRLQNVIAWINRFIYNLRNPTTKLSGELSVQELRQSLITCVYVTQSFYLQEDISAVQHKKMCSSGIRSLSPFLHPLSGVLLVGGRLANAPVPEEFKHPMLIPKCHLAVLLVWHYHHITLHGGPKLVQSFLQQRFWIVGGRNLIRHKLASCVTCIRTRPKLPQPYMADLPISRFAQGRPFINTGVDFAGPFLYKTGPRRNSPVDKCYFALFVCMATKCVHLENVSSLSTPAFLGAFDRFIARRGLPSCMWSDNGSNFKGADSYLQSVQKHLTKQEVKWFFIPPSAPNFGGLWEAGVKSAKYHLKHILGGNGGTAYNFEEITSLLCRVESILNSRPLCPLSSNPNDGVDYLTPGHFLIGAPLLARPQQNITTDNISYLTRWKRISHIIQVFWKRWSADYLNTLVQRSKSQKISDNLKCGDIVLIASDQFTSQKWPLGKITETLPGKDGVLRVAKVKTSSGEFIRPVSKLVVLPKGDF